MEAPASSRRGDALEQQLTSQVEADTEASLTGEAEEQLPQTGLHQINAFVVQMQVLGRSKLHLDRNVPHARIQTCVAKLCA